jgi:hypothetical protein
MPYGVQGIAPLLQNSGTFTVDASAAPNGVTLSTAVNNSGTMSTAGPQLQLAGTAGVTDSSVIAGAVISAPTTTASGAQLTSDTISGGVLTIPAGSTASASNLTTSNATLQGGGTLTTTGTFAFGGTAQGQVALVVPAGSTMAANGAVLTDGAQLETDGTTTLGFSGVQMRGASGWLNTGTIDVGSGLSIATDPGYGGTPLQLFNTGTISLAATDDNHTIGGVVNDGTISVSRGQLTINDLTETIDGTVAIGIHGPNAQTDYGQLVAYPGLSGTLQIALDPSYTPAVGAKFDVISSAGVITSEPFSSLVGLGSLSPAWSTDTYVSQLELTATAAPHALRPPPTPATISRPAAPAGATAITPPGAPTAIAPTGSFTAHRLAAARALYRHWQQRQHLRHRHRHAARRHRRPIV